MKLPTMYKLYRRFFPKLYYNREFRLLDPLLRKLAVPFEPSYLEMEMWGPPLSRNMLGDIYAFIFFDTPCNCTDINIMGSAVYMREIAEENGFTRMADFTRYYEYKRREMKKHITKLIKEGKHKQKS